MATRAERHASHTGRFKADRIAYFELADIFRGAIRNNLRRLFPPDGDVNYAGIGMTSGSFLPKDSSRSYVRGGPYRGGKEGSDRRHHECEQGDQQ